MNPFLQILLTVALVIGGVATYHVVAGGEPAADTAGVVPVGDRDLADLEARLAVLENRQPLLRGSDDGAILRDLLARVEALETAGPAERRRAGTVASSPEGEDAAPATVGTPGADADVEVALTDAQQKAVRRLVDGAMRERMQSRFAGRTDRVLRDLGIELTDDQRTKLDAAWAAHMEKVRDVFESGRDAGRSREDVGAELSALNAKLTESLTGFLPAGDAESITTALTSMGRGPGRGPPPQDGGGGGPR